MRNLNGLVGRSVPVVGLALLAIGIWLAADGPFNIGIALVSFGIFFLVVGGVALQ